MDYLSYIFLSIQAFCLAASTVTIREKVLGTAPKRHELLCSWNFNRTFPVIFRKNQSGTFEDIVFITTDCKLKAQTNLNGIKCGCIDSYRAGCNITQTLDSGDAEEWMCVVPFQGRNKNSNVINITYTEFRTSTLPANGGGTTTKTRPATVTSFYINDMHEEFNVTPNVTLNVTLIETGNGSIHCIGEGNPAPSLILIKHSTDDEHNKTLYAVNNSTHLRYDTSKFGSHHSGKYTCVSSNRFGEDHRTLHLIIKPLEEIANIMHGSSVTLTETAVLLKWTLDDNTLFHLVANTTCYLVYRTGEETKWINVLKELKKTVTLTTIMLDLELNNLRPDTQYEVQLIASLQMGNYSIAPSFTFKTLSLSQATGIDVVVAPIVCSVLIICVGFLLRVYMKRSLRNEAKVDIDNIRKNAPVSRSTMNAVGNAPAFILSDDDDHYDCIELTRTQSCINVQDDRSGRFESVPPRVIGRTNLHDEICLQTHTANKIAYDFLDHTGNPTEEQYNSMGEIVEDSCSSDTDSIISDSCLQYLTVIGNLPIPPESVCTSAYDDVANTTRPPLS
ncbi:uncharacterized protein LOC127873510 [Dreissena polymorpha]|uniref:uncharacterized protein LOC127873510 n=1 Tax=Dreissena polymorpha TaxID=45954 RepID=UPI002264E57F|nr:uncharacterized protein LOC127873510 [Dreissena polymorpha]XP_052273352.1 uncharacterized protein LOC127873510 [Dreissena polymorpha]